MKKIFKGMIVVLGLLIALGGNCMSVEAAPKARVKSVKAYSNKKNEVKVNFKKDSKAKKYGIKNYKIRLTKYSYSTKNKKWSKGKSYYKYVSAYSGRKLKSSTGVTFTKKPVNNDTMYRVSVASANSKKVAKTNYSSAVSVGCMHDWLWKSTSEKVKVKDAVYEKQQSMRCEGCGMEGSGKEVGNHLAAYVNDLANEQYNILNSFCQEFNLKESDILDSNGNCVSDDMELKFTNYIVSYMNKKYGYTTKLYTSIEDLRDGSSVIGCSSDYSTGKYIDVLVSPAEYKTVIVMKATCDKCNSERTEK